MERIFSLDDIQDAAREVWRQSQTATVLAFHGQMGAGKTTFIHALCDVKGVKDVVGSPTFPIINEYLFTENSEIKKIYHIDLYRLNSENEAIQAGVEDCLYSDHICLVEWPERAPDLLPPHTINIYIEVVDTIHRKLVASSK